MKKVNINNHELTSDELTRLILEALKKSTYGGTKTGEPRPGDHGEE